MVDLIIGPRGMRQAEPVTVGENDLVASEVPGLQWLANSPKLEAVVEYGNRCHSVFPIRVYSHYTRLGSHSSQLANCSRSSGICQRFHKKICAGLFLGGSVDVGLGSVKVRMWY